jgi:tellurite resistance-related uncharacterized protein
MKYLVQVFGTNYEGNKISKDVVLTSDEFEKFKNLCKTFLKVYTKLKDRYDNICVLSGGLEYVELNYERLKNPENVGLLDYLDGDLKMLDWFSINEIKDTQKFIYLYLCMPNYCVNEFTEVKYFEITDEQNFKTL